MKSRTLGLMFCSAALLAPIVVAEQKPEPTKQRITQPAAIINKYKFFGKQAYITEPKIEAVLLLSDEQKKKLSAIERELLIPVFTQESKRNLEERKAGKRATREERKADMFKLASQILLALREVQKRAKNILVPEQLSLIATIDAALKADPKVKIETLLNSDQIKALRQVKA